MGTVARDTALEMRVRLTADVASVPGARRFVTDGLRHWQRGHLADDAALCITEMAANAALHSGSRYMQVAMVDLGRTVRISIEDAGGMVPLPAVAPPPVPSTADTGPVDELGTTGRGLAIVSVLAESWGIDEHPEGRRVWAHLTGDGVEHEVRPPRIDSSEETVPAPTALPAGWVRARMPGCPVRLALRIDRRLDDLVRELQLIDSEEGPTPPRELGRLIERLVTRPAYARHLGRRIALDAAAAGMDRVDLEMTLPREMAPTLRDLLAADNLADEVCRTHRLLTPPSTPAMVSLRTWIAESVLDQADHDTTPVAYDDWLRRQR